MSVVIMLMLCSISIAALFLGAFIWNIKKGQYDDETAPPVRILFEDPYPSSRPVTGGDHISNQNV